MNINAEFYKGKDLFENGKYEDALGTLLQCYEYSIKNNNNDINEITFLNIIALCYERLGNYLDKDFLFV